MNLDSILSGHVRSGKGDAAQWLTRFATEYAKKLGAPIFPGSLNVKLPEHFDWFAPALQPLIIQLARHEYGGERDILLIPCVLHNLGGQHAFLWSTTTAARSRDDPTVVEIIAPVGLRAAHHLLDGDLVEFLLRRPS